MPKLTFSGVDELQDAFGRISEWPESLKEDALKAMASVAAAKVRASGEAMGVRDPQSSVHILDKIKPQKPKTTKSGGYLDITFSGSRRRGNTTTRNAEIAFGNEYGKRGQPARPFIGTGMTQNEQQIAAPAGELVGDWIEREFQR